MQQGVDRIDAVLDRVMDELGNPGARAEVAESIGRSFEIFHLYDELSGRVGRQNLITSAGRIAAAITTLEDQLHAAIAALSALENQLRTAHWYLMASTGRSWMHSSTQPTSRYSHGGSHV
jgi:hypothetical protein